MEEKEEMEEEEEGPCINLKYPRFER